MAGAAIIEGGFVDPVFATQAVFRDLMEAMAWPGTVRAFAPDLAPPAPLSATAAAIALTLCDHDTPVWLDAAMGGGGAVAQWLAFHSGAGVTTDPAQARFALMADASGLGDLARFAQGSQDYPDRSTTLIVQVSALNGGMALRLQGPGIEAAARLAPAPLPECFIGQWTRNAGRFPRGVDIVFAAPDALACLPRTTRIDREQSACM